MYVPATGMAFTTIGDEQAADVDGGLTSDDDDVQHHFAFLQNVFCNNDEEL